MHSIKFKISLETELLRGAIEKAGFKQVADTITSHLKGNLMI